MLRPRHMPLVERALLLVTCQCKNGVHACRTRHTQIFALVWSRVDGLWWRGWWRATAAAPARARHTPTRRRRRHRRRCRSWPRPPRPTGATSCMPPSRRSLPSPPTPAPPLSPLPTQPPLPPPPTQTQPLPPPACPHHHHAAAVLLLLLAGRPPPAALTSAATCCLHRARRCPCRCVRSSAADGGFFTRGRCSGTALRARARRCVHGAARTDTALCGGGPDHAVL